MLLAIISPNVLLIAANSSGGVKFGSLTACKTKPKSDPASRLRVMTRTTRSRLPRACTGAAANNRDKIVSTAIGVAAIFRMMPSFRLSLLQCSIVASACRIPQGALGYNEQRCSMEQLSAQCPSFTAPRLVFGVRWARGEANEATCVAPDRYFIFSISSRIR